MAITIDGSNNTIEGISNTIEEDDLKISNAGSNGQFLSKQSGNTGGLTWATVDTSIADDSIVEAKLDVSNAPTNGQFLQAQSGEGGGLTWAAAGGGKILQGPVRATDANMGVRFLAANASGTWTDTGYDVVITPTSATSWIQVHFQLYISASSGTEPEWKIQANGVDKDIGNPIYIDVSGGLIPNWVWTYAPGSTSQQTISLWIKAAGTGNVYHGSYPSQNIPSSPNYGYRNFNDAYAYEIEQ